MNQSSFLINSESGVVFPFLLVEARTQGKECKTSSHQQLQSMHYVSGTTLKTPCTMYIPEDHETIQGTITSRNAKKSKYLPQVPSPDITIKSSRIYSSSSSPSRSAFWLAGLASAFCQTVRAASWLRSAKRMSKTSEYQLTGWPSMPSLMFY